MACMGHGMFEGRVSEWSSGEILSLSESSCGQKSAELRPKTAAGDHPAPGVHCLTHTQHSKSKENLQAGQEISLLTET